MTFLCVEPPPHSYWTADGCSSQAIVNAVGRVGRASDSSLMACIRKRPDAIIPPLGTQPHPRVLRQMTCKLVSFHVNIRVFLPIWHLLGEVWCFFKLLPFFQNIAAGEKGNVLTFLQSWPENPLFTSLICNPLTEKATQAERWLKDQIAWRFMCLSYLRTTILTLNSWVRVEQPLQSAPSCSESARMNQAICWKSQCHVIISSCMWTVLVWTQSQFEFR